MKKSSIVVGVLGVVFGVVAFTNTMILQTVMSMIGKTDRVAITVGSVYFLGMLIAGIWTILNADLDNRELMKEDRFKLAVKPSVLFILTGVFCLASSLRRSYIMFALLAIVLGLIYVIKAAKLYRKGKK
mgnify:CR=1 FL=1